MPINIPSKSEENPYKFHEEIAAIGPKGEWVSRLIRKEVRHLSQNPGVHPIRWNNGAAQLDPHFAAKGWVLYEDLCRGLVPGVKANMKKLELFKEIQKMKAAGREIPLSTLPEEEWLHPEVYRRRREQGSNSVRADELSRFIQATEAGEDWEDALAAASSNEQEDPAGPVGGLSAFIGEDDQPSKKKKARKESGE